MMLAIQTRNVEPDIDVVEVGGHLVMGQPCQDLQWTIDDLLGKSKKKILLDVTKVTYSDSAGVGAIVSSCGRVKKAGGQIRVAGAAGKLADLFKVTKVQRMIAIDPVVDDALAKLRSA